MDRVWIGRAIAGPENVAHKHVASSGVSARLALRTITDGSPGGAIQGVFDVVSAFVRALHTRHQNQLRAFAQSVAQI
jgi:hypothetical protein